MSIEQPTLATTMADLRVLASASWRKVSPKELFDEWGLDFPNSQILDMTDDDALGEDRMAVRYLEGDQYVIELWRFIEENGEDSNLVRTYRIRAEEMVIS